MIDKALFTLPGFRRALAVMAVAAACTGACVIGQALSLATALTNLWNGSPLPEQVVWLAVFACCFLLRQVVANAQGRWLDAYAAARADELRDAVLRRLFAEGRALVQRTGSGNLTTLVMEGVDQVEAYLRIILPKMAAIVIIPVMLLAVVFPLDWVSGLIALIVFPAIILQMVLIGSTAQQVAAARHEEFQGLSNHFADSLRGIDTLKLFGRSKAHGRAVYESSERFREATMRTLRVATLSSAVLDLFSTVSLAAVAVMLGFRLVDGSVALFPALAVLVALPEYFRPIKEFASDYHASLDGKNALVSLLSLAGEGEAVRAAEAEGAGEAPEAARAEAPASESGASDAAGASETAKAGEHAGDSQPTAPQPAQPARIPAWGEDAELSLSRVSFAYEERAADGRIVRHEALRDATFTVRGFRNVGVVGPSGGGKSTLVSLLAGFAAPTSGTIAVNGETAQSLELPEWRRQVAYIPQSPYLFHATLRENLTFYRPDAADAEVAEAVRVVGLERLVSELPEGLDTLVGEGARALSGGQAQRIALARAVLDPARVVWLLDEPTAHLDIETEMELKERMLPLMEGRLVILATHRLHWLDAMDQVVVLEDGSAEAPESGALERFVKSVRGGERA